MQPTKQPTRLEIHKFRRLSNPGCYTFGVRFWFGDEPDDWLAIVGCLLDARGNLYIPQVSGDSYTQILKYWDLLLSNYTAEIKMRLADCIQLEQFSWEGAPKLS